MEDRAFLEMKKAAAERLRRKDPLEIARNAGVIVRAGTLDSCDILLKSLGEDVTVGFPSCEVRPEMEKWRCLLLLHYLELADGAPLSGEWAPFGEMKNGMIRGTEFDRSSEARLRTLLKGKRPEQIRERCRKLDAIFPEEKPDLCAVFFLFPRFPLRLNIWFEDEEFPASGKLLVDRRAEHYLTIEDAVTAGEVLLARLNEMDASR